MPKKGNGQAAPKKEVRGRPTIYTVELGERICDEVRNGVHGLTVICDSNDDFPCSKTVKNWLFQGIHPEFNENYNMSKRFQAESLADEVLRVAYNAKQWGKSGAVEKEKLIVDALKWAAAHLAPKRWGDKSHLAEDEEKQRRYTEEEVRERLSKIIDNAEKRVKKQK